MDITQNNDSSIKNGYDNFEKDEFSGNVWSTPVLISPEELKNRLRGYRLEGRTIADIKLVGYCYSLSYYVLESKVVIESDEYDDNYDSVFDRKWNLAGIGRCDPQRGKVRPHLHLL